MKIGTDSMLLGSWADPSGAGCILVVGTGCGVLALMMAQKSGCIIDAIDIHLPSFEEASGNFRASPWACRINIFHSSIRDFSQHNSRKYDLIISNPPFFSNSIKPADPAKLISRHEHSLDLKSLVDYCFPMMKKDASLVLILPVQESKALLSYSSTKNLYPHKVLKVKADVTKLPGRILLRMGFGARHSIEEELSICTPEGEFTKDYLKLTRDFHFFTEKDS
jgi:tRNA1Val (adenine37-N6)-methyltransferase